MSATDIHTSTVTGRLQDRLKGVTGIAVTPFDASGKIDEDALKINLDDLVKSGITSITVCGNTGEYFSLTDAECRRVVELSCKQLAGKATVIVGVGGDGSRAAEQARHAIQCGADAAMVHFPPHPFVSGPGYVRYVRSVVDAIGTGVIPYLRGQNIPDDASLLELTRLEEIVAVKYAVNDLPRFGTLANHPDRGDITWICGSAETWAPLFWALGATGFTSGLVNVAPKLSLALLKALRNGVSSEVRRWWALIKPFEDLRARNGGELNVSVVKEAMAQLKLGPRYIRPPIAELDPRDREAVTAILKRWEFDL